MDRLCDLHIPCGETLYISTHKSTVSHSTKYLIFFFLFGNTLPTNRSSNTLFTYDFKPITLQRGFNKGQMEKTNKYIYVLTHLVIKEASLVNQVTNKYVEHVINLS